MVGNCGSLSTPDFTGGIMDDYNEKMKSPKREVRQGAYREKLASVTEDDLYEHCKRYIWLSAYANNNPRSDFHWMVDSCYDECKRRGKINEIYQKAYDVLWKSER